MEAKFNRAVSINGVTFTRGVHEVPDKVTAHPHFDHYLKLKVIVDPSEDSPTPETEQHRTERLAKMVAAKIAAPVEVESPVSDEPEEKKELSKKKHKR